MCHIMQKSEHVGYDSDQVEQGENVAGFILVVLHIIHNTGHYSLRQSNQNAHNILRWTIW